jgi:hypothetical protein
MKILISVDGVLRNTIQKFNYHYVDAYLNSEFENENNFNYSINEPIYNDNLLNHYSFQSKEEFDYFLFIEYPIEIFGHAGLSYSNVFTELNKIIYDNPEHEFTLIGIDELAKSKPATLFFLSKNGFLGNNIKFSTSDKISELWNEYDVWITDNKKIIDLCPTEKISYKFNTTYNQYFTNKKEIHKLTEIDEPWLRSSEKTTTLTLTQSQKNVEQETK